MTHYCAERVDMISLVLVHTPIGRKTTTTAVARRPSHVTVMVVEPPRNAVTSPVLDTLPTASSLLVHVIARPGTGRPEASHIAAVSCTVPCTTTSTDSGTIVTAAMGGGGAIGSREAATSNISGARRATTRTRAALWVTPPPPPPRPTNSRGCWTRRRGPPA